MSVENQPKNYIPESFLDAANGDPRSAFGLMAEAEMKSRETSMATKTEIIREIAEEDPRSMAGIIAEMNLATIDRGANVSFRTNMAIQETSGIPMTSGQEISTTSGSNSTT